MFSNAFTWSKNLDIASDTEGSTLNPYNFNYDRTLSQFDIKFNYSASVNYELPFGTGKKLAASLPRGANLLASGWSVNFLVFARSGLPLNVTQQQGVISTGTGNRPDRIASGKLDNQTPDHWFDLSAFTPTRDNTGTFGNSGRNILDQPGS